MIICDDVMMRDQQPHEPLTDKSPPTAVKALVYLHNPSTAKAKSARFDVRWHSLISAGAEE